MIVDTINGCPVVHIETGSPEGGFAVYYDDFEAVCGRSGLTKCKLNKSGMKKAAIDAKIVFKAYVQYWGVNEAYEHLKFIGLVKE
jgi:hypothetical protein